MIFRVNTHKALELEKVAIWYLQISQNKKIKGESLDYTL